MPQFFFNFYQIANISITTLHSPMTAVFIIKSGWPWSDENCTRSRVLKFPAPYGSVLTKMSKWHKIFKFWQITKNSYSLNSLMTNMLTMNLDWNWMKTRGAEAFENLNIGNFAKCTEWPQTKLKKSGIKNTLHMCTVVPRVPNFRPFGSTISRFQDIAHSMILPIDSYVKISYVKVP